MIQISHGCLEDYYTSKPEWEPSQMMMIRITFKWTRPDCLGCKYACEWVMRYPHHIVCNEVLMHEQDFDSLVCLYPWEMHILFIWMIMCQYLPDCISPPVYQKLIDLRKQFNCHLVREKLLVWDYVHVIHPTNQSIMHVNHVKKTTMTDWLHVNPTEGTFCFGSVMKRNMRICTSKVRTLDQSHVHTCAVVFISVSMLLPFSEKSLRWHTFVFECNKEEYAALHTRTCLPKVLWKEQVFLNNIYMPPLSYLQLTKRARLASKSMLLGHHLL